MKKQFAWIFALIASLNVASAFADLQEEDTAKEPVQEEQEIAVIVEADDEDTSE